MCLSSFLFVRLCEFLLRGGNIWASCIMMEYVSFWIQTWVSHLPVLDSHWLAVHCSVSEHLPPFYTSQAAKIIIFVAFKLCLKHQIQPELPPLLVGIWSLFDKFVNEPHLLCNFIASFLKFPSMSSMLVFENQLDCIIVGVLAHCNSVIYNGIAFLLQHFEMKWFCE